MGEIRDIGIDVATPTGEWDGNQNCPFYGNLRVRGQIIEGKIVSAAVSYTHLRAHETN